MQQPTLQKTGVGEAMEACQQKQKGRVPVVLECREAGSGLAGVQWFLGHRRLGRHHHVWSRLLDSVKFCKWDGLMRNSHTNHQPSVLSLT